MSDDPHTCHFECPCHTGGEPTPDFVETYTAPSIFRGPSFDRLRAKHEAQRAELEELLTPEGLAALDAAEEEAMRKALGA